MSYFNIVVMTMKVSYSKIFIDIIEGEYQNREINI